MAEASSAFDLSGRRALVTGASGGLGQHFAEVLARAGATVVLAARRSAELSVAVEAIEASGGKAFAVTMDVCDPDSIVSAYEQAATAAGSLDILVNNSGVAVTASALDMAESDWDRVLDTNLKGAWLVARAFARQARAAAHGGSIINIASILGFRVAGHVSAYAVSKAGLVQLTESLALEFARYGIRVNALAPGYIATEINADFFATDAGKAMVSRIPQRRLGRLDDLDGPLLLLASDASRYMTGASLAVDGGHLVSSL